MRARVPSIQTASVARGTFNFLDFLNADSLLVLHQVAPDWKPRDASLDYIEPLPEIERLMQQKPVDRRGE